LFAGQASVGAPGEDSDQVSTDKMVLVLLQDSSEVFFLQPAVSIALAHGEGNTSLKGTASGVALSGSGASEVLDVSSPVVDVVDNSGFLGGQSSVGAPGVNGIRFLAVNCSDFRAASVPDDPSASTDSFVFVESTLVGGSNSSGEAL